MSDQAQVRPESQTVRGCAGLREDCQAKIFENIRGTRITLENKMDDQHKIQMGAINNVNETLSFMRGQASVSKDTLISADKEPQTGVKSFILQAIISWGPWLLMVFGLGLITLWNSKK